MPPESNSGPVVSYQLHPNVHSEWGGQSLYFLFCSFRLSYDSRAVADALKRAFDEHDVTAQASYELIGSFDLMLRIWLSPVRLRAFRATLKASLNPLSLHSDIVISVAEVVRHWPWGETGRGHDGRGPLRATQVDLGGGASPDTLRLLGELASTEPSEIPNADLEALLGDGLVAEVEMRSGDGIKLVTLVTGATMSNQEVDALQGLIARRLDSADHDVFSECSLYRAESSETPFVIMCRVSSDGFRHIGDSLFDRLHELLIGKARTSTYPVVRQSLVPSGDAIASLPPPAGRRDRRSIEDLLADDESATLEVKATAFGAVDPWLHGHGPIAESDTIFERGVLKSVVAFLNTEGGTVVIGALEADRYRALSESVDSKLEQFPVNGQYICVGLIDPSYVDNGWDKYERRLADLLDRRISNTPVATSAVTIERVTYLDREFCLIHVDAPGDDRWYYGQPSGGEKAQHFYVRRGASVIDLQGAEADDFKRRRLNERANQPMSGVRGQR